MRNAMNSNGVTAIAACAVLLLAPGCSRSGDAAGGAAAGGGSPAAKTAEAAEQRYPLTGEIVRVEADRKVLVAGTMKSRATCRR